MQTPILGQAYVARSVNAADNQLINLFLEGIPEGGKTGGFFVRCPGLRTLATVGVGPIRGFRQYGNYGYVVSGQELYKIDTSYTSTLIGTVLGTDRVSMSDNGDLMFIAAVDHSYQYLSSTNAFSEITDANFIGAKTVGYIDGYFVFNQPGTQQIQVVSSVEADGSSIYPLVFDATLVAFVQGAPDELLALTNDHREVWMFGTNTIEVWYDAGIPGFPLERIQGAFLELGCAAAYSVAKLDNSLFWLGSDPRGAGIVYRANGYNGQRISTHAVEFAIQSYSDISDAVAYTYQQEGHSFYVLNFPTGNATWVYDVSTNAWHQRAYFNAGADTFERHRGNCQMYFNGQTIVGDYQNGKIYAFDLDYYKDGDDLQKWLRSWRALPTGQNNLKRTAQHSLQLDCEAGVGLGGTNTGVTRTILGVSVTDDNLRMAYHTFQVNDCVRFTAGTDVISGLTGNTNYYIQSILATRTFTATTTTGSTTLTSPSNFLSTDGNAVISDAFVGTGVDTIPPGTYVSAYVSASNVRMSAAAGDALTGSVTFTPYKVRLSQSPDGAVIDITAVTAGTSLGSLQLVTESDPQVMLRWSDDGGHTWSNEHWRSMGKLGEYGYRTIWRRLGMTTKLRDRVYEVSGTDPVKIAITGAELILNQTSS